MDKEITNMSNSDSAKRKCESEIKSIFKSGESNIQYGGVSTNDKDNEPVVNDIENLSTCAKIRKIVCSLTIEPVMFTFMFGYIMNMSVLSNMTMNKGCLYYYNYSEEICKNISVYEAEKHSIEVLAADYSIYGNLLSFIAAFLMIFISTWSDKYGRKLPLIIALFGSFLTDLGYILCTKFYDSRLEYLILSKLPVELSGGFICIFSIMFSLASELSSLKNRSLKYTSVEVAFGLGIALGGLTGGMLFRYYGYIYIYTSAASLHLFGCLWVFFIVEETRGLDVKISWYEKAKDFFVFTSISDNLTATFKRRPGNTRMLLLLLMVSMCIIVLNYESFSTVAFIYVHHIFNWDPAIYSIVSTSTSVLSLFLTLVLMPVFIRVFKFNDFTLGILGSISFMTKNLLIAFSRGHVYIYYAGMATGVFGGLTTLSIRTGISKLVHKDELGRVFSFLATCETIFPMLGTVLVTKLFTATMDSYPNVAYASTVLCLCVPLVTFIWALKTTKIFYKSLNIVSSNDQGKEKV